MLWRFNYNFDVPLCTPVILCSLNSTKSLEMVHFYIIQSIAAAKIRMIIWIDPFCNQSKKSCRFLVKITGDSNSVFALKQN